MDKNGYSDLEDDDNIDASCSPCCYKYNKEKTIKVANCPPGSVPVAVIMQPQSNQSNQEIESAYLVPVNDTGQQQLVVVTTQQPLGNQFPSEQRQYTTDDVITELSQKLGRIQFGIKYDFEKSILEIRIIRAVNLEAKDMGGTSDPYVKVVLLPDKNVKLYTKRKRKNLNPRWNETFSFEDYPYDKVITRTLFLQILDYDRFSKDDPIGEIQIPMTEFDLKNGQVLWKNLHPSESKKGRLGDLCLTLCYDEPEIKITVIKATNLKAKDINGTSDPYVKIWHISDSKKIEKKKTGVMDSCLNPVYNETFVFTVPLDKVRQTSFLVSVMDYDQFGRNEPIGQIILGSKSAPDQVKHWSEMFAKPRQDVVQWHALKAFE